MNKIILPVGQNPTNPIPPVVPDLTDLVIGTETFKINKEGNAVDTAGKVLKTKDELEKLKTGNPANPPVQTDAEKEAARLLAEKETNVEKQLVEGTEIELDGVLHKLTKDGTIVDAAGKVLKTKAELKALLIANEDEGELNYINEIQKATNLIITNDDKPVTYENTVEGLTQYTQDVYGEGRRVGSTEYEAELTAKFPILPAILEHLALHGSLKNFIEEVDYHKVILTDDESQHIDIYTKAKLKQGVPQSEINDLVKYLKDDRKLKTAAESSLTYLKATQTAEATTRAARLKEQKDAEEAAEKAYWDEVGKAITSKELVIDSKKFKIPDIIKIKTADGKIVTKTPADFKKYIEQPLQFKINNQIHTMTQHEYDVYLEDNKRTPHHDIFDAYRRFVKYDDSQIIAANISSGVVKEVIKLKSKAGGQGGNPVNTTGKKLVLPIK